MSEIQTPNAPAFVPAMFVDKNRAEFDALYTGEPKFRAVYDTLVQKFESEATAEVDKQEAQGIITVCWMNGAKFAFDNMNVFKTRSASKRVSAKPEDRTWDKAFHDELLDLIQTTAIEALPGIRDRIVSGDIPSKGAPEKLADLTGDALIQAVFNYGSSHTVLRAGKTRIKVPAVNGITGEVRHEKDGSPALKAISFGWRSDGCRPVKKKKVVKSEQADASAPEKADAPAPPPGA